MEEIKDALSDIGAFNAAKKRGAALALLEKWYPAVERFEMQVKRLEKSFDSLKAENAALSVEVDQTEKRQFEAFAKYKILENEVSKYRKMMKKLPPEVQQQLMQKDKKRNSDDFACVAHGENTIIVTV